MGVKCSKHLDPSDADYEDGEDQQFRDTVIEFNAFDKEFIKDIRHDFRDNPEVFVFNNIIMAVKFFQNHKTDIDSFSEKRTEDDGRILAPDVILEKVYDNVRYRPFHGPMKHNSEPICNQRLFVFSDDLLVIGSMDSAENLDRNGNKPIVRIEESQRKGFVKLREIETTPSSSGDMLQIPISRSEPASRSSTDSDSTNTYSALNEMKTPKPIEIIKGLERKDFIHASCIAHRRIRKKETDLYLEDRSPEDINEDEFFEIASYISSGEYMKYFRSSLFPNQIAKQIGLTDEEVMGTKHIPGKVFCTVDDVPLDVIPAIPTEWPAEQTLSFAMKGERMNERMKQTRFPTPTMISDCQKLKCALVPKGYFRKREERIDSDIEWEICFPQAQRYLESYMSYPQLKVLLILLTIHKTYIEPHTYQLGLLPEHIRNFMLWECEANYTDWPEHRLGSKLISVIRNLNGYIAQANLPDYFIKEKNMLENIHKKYLRFAQKVFHDILQSPLMNFIKSLRNLRYANGKSFYPPFDFDTAYKTLISTDPMAVIAEENNDNNDSNDDNISNTRTQKILDSETQLRQIQQAKQRSKVINERYAERRESVDSINVDWVCEKEFDVYKKKDLLILFISTFLQIAKKCSLISSKKQTQFYLKQARYLTRIFKDECGAFEEEARSFLDMIREEEAECDRRSDETEAGRVGFESHVLRKIVQSSMESDKNDKFEQKVTGRKSVTFEAEIHTLDTDEVF